MRRDVDSQPPPAHDGVITGQRGGDARAQGMRFGRRAGRARLREHRRSGVVDEVGSARDAARSR